jgi:hypothetical protein
MAKLLKVLGALVLLGVLVLGGLLLYVQANQQTLIAQVKQKLNEEINGELSIGGVRLSLLNDFPKLSLTLRDFSLRDSAYRKEIFTADRIYLRLNLLQLFTKQLDFSKITVADGKLFLLHDSSGYSNTDIIRVKHDKGGKMDFDFKELDIKNVKLDIHEEDRGKHMSFAIVRLSGTIPKGGASPVLHLSGLMKIDSMLFKRDKGAFFRNKLARLDLNVSIDNDKMQLVIHPSRFEIDNQFYDGKGFFDFSKSPGYLSLEFTNPKADFTVAKGILSEQIQDYMKDIVLKDSVDVKVTVKGTINPDFPPEVNAAFNLTRATVVFAGVTLTDFTVRGLFINHVVPGIKNDDYNSALRFDVPFVKLEGIPLSANVVINDLKAMRMAMNSKCQTSLTAVNQVLPGSSYEFIGGAIDLALTYHGTLSHYKRGNQQKEKTRSAVILKSRKAVLCMRFAVSS